MKNVIVTKDVKQEAFFHQIIGWIAQYENVSPEKERELYFKIVNAVRDFYMGSR